MSSGVATAPRASSGTGGDKNSGAANEPSGGPQTLDEVFEALDRSMTVGDIVQINQSVSHMLKFVDKVPACNHFHGRRAPLNRIHDLNARHPNQKKAFMSQLLVFQILPAHVEPSADALPPDFEELWCAIRNHRPDWIRWWVHYLPLASAALSPHDARILVNTSQVGVYGTTSDKPIIYLGPRSLPATFPAMLSSIALRTPPPMQELLLQELSRRGLIVRQEVSYFTSTAVTLATRKAALSAHTGQEKEPVLQAASTAAAALIAPLLSFDKPVGPNAIAEIAAGRVPKGAMLLHPHEITTTAGISPVDFTYAALRLTRAGLLFAPRNDAELIPFADGGDRRILDPIHKLQIAENRITRSGILQALVPIGRMTPFHRFICNYLHTAGLQSALTVYRAWYQLPAIESDDLLKVNYKLLLRYVSEPQKQTALLTAFHLKTTQIPLRLYNEADNMFLSFKPESFEGLYQRWRSDRPVCLNTLMRDLGYPLKALLAQASARAQLMTGAAAVSDHYIDFFHRFGAFWLSRGAPTQAIATLLSNVRLVSKTLDAHAMHRLRHHTCTLAALMLISNTDMKKIAFAQNEVTRRKQASKQREERRHRSQVTSDADDDFEEEEEEKRLEREVVARRVGGANVNGASNAGSSLITDANSFTESPDNVLEWMRQYHMLTDCVNTFLVMIESYDSNDRARNGLGAGTFYGDVVPSDGRAVSSVLKQQTSQSDSTSALTTQPLAIARQSRLYSVLLTLFTLSVEWFYQAEIYPPQRPLQEQLCYAFSEGMDRILEWTSAADSGEPWPEMDLSMEGRQQRHPALNWVVESLCKCYVNAREDNLQEPTAGYVLRVLTTICLAFHWPFPTELSEWWLCTPHSAPTENLIPGQPGTESVAHYQLSKLVLYLLDSGMKPTVFMTQLLASPSRGLDASEAISLAAGAPFPNELDKLISESNDVTLGRKDSLKSDPAAAILGINSSDTLLTPTVVEKLMQHMAILTHREQPWLVHILFGAPAPGRIGLQALVNLSIRPSTFFENAFSDDHQRLVLSKISLPELAVYQTTNDDGSIATSVESQAKEQKESEAESKEDASRTKLRNRVYEGLADKNAERLYKIVLLLVSWLRAGQFNMMRQATQIAFPRDPLAHFTSFLVAFHRRLYVKPINPSNQSKQAFNFLHEDNMRFTVSSAQQEAGAGRRMSTVALGISDSATAEVLADVDLADESKNKKGQETNELGSEGSIEYYFSRFVESLESLSEHSRGRTRAGLIKVQGRRVWSGQAEWTRKVCVEVWNNYLRNQTFLSQYERQYLECIFHAYGWNDGLESLAKLPGGLVSKAIQTSHHGTLTTSTSSQQEQAKPKDRTVTQAMAAAERVAQNALGSLPSLVVGQSHPQLVEIARRTYVDLLDELAALVEFEKLGKAAGGMNSGDRTHFIDITIAECHRVSMPLYMRASLFYNIAASLMPLTELPSMDSPVAGLLDGSAQAAEPVNPAQASLDCARKLAQLATSTNPAAEQSFATQLAAMQSSIHYKDAGSFVPSDAGNVLGETLFPGLSLRSQIPVHPVFAAQLAMERRTAAMQVVRALLLASTAWKALLDQDAVRRHFEDQELRGDVSAQAEASRIAIPLGEPATGASRLSLPARAHTCLCVRRANARAYWFMTLFDVHSVSLGDKSLLTAFAYRPPASTVASLSASGVNLVDVTGAPNLDLNQEISEDKVIISRAQLQEKYDRDVAALRAKLLAITKSQSQAQSSSSQTIPVALLGLEDFSHISNDAYVPWRPKDVIERRRAKNAAFLALMRLSGQEPSSADTAWDENEDDDEDLFDDKPELDTLVASAVIACLIRHAQIRSALTLVAEISRRPADDPTRGAVLTLPSLTFFHILHLVSWIADPNLDILEAVGGRRSLAAEFVRVPWLAAPAPESLKLSDSKELTNMANNGSDGNYGVGGSDLVRQSWDRSNTSGTSTGNASGGSASGATEDPDIDDPALLRVLYFLHNAGLSATEAAAARSRSGSVTSSLNDSTQSTSDGQSVAVSGAETAAIDAANAADRSLRELWKRLAQLATAAKIQSNRLAFARPLSGPSTFLEAQAVGKPSLKSIPSLITTLYGLNTKWRVLILEEFSRFAMKYILPAMTSLCVDSTNRDSLLVASMVHALPDIVTLYAQARHIATVEEKQLLEARVRTHFIRVAKSPYGNDVPVARSTHVATTLGLLATRTRPVSLSSWQPATLPHILAVAKKYELSPVTVLGASPSALIAEILVRNSRSGSTLVDPLSLFSTSRTSSVANTADLDSYSAAKAASKSFAQEKPPVLDGANSSSLFEAAKHREKLAQERAVWQCIRELLVTGQFLLHVRAHFLVQRSHALSANAALPASLTFSQAKGSHERGDFEALAMETLVDSLVTFHRHKFVRLGVVQWDDIQYGQFVGLSALVNPWSGSPMYWQRRFGDSLWARLHILFPTILTNARTGDVASESWRFARSTLGHRAYAERVPIISNTGGPNSNAMMYAARKSMADRAHTQRRVMQEKSVDTNTPVLFHLPSEVNSLELEAALLIAPCRAYEEATHALGMNYCFIEFHHRSSMQLTVSSPSFRDEKYVWEDARKLINPPDYDGLMQRLNSLIEMDANEFASVVTQLSDNVKQFVSAYVARASVGTSNLILANHVHQTILQIGGQYQHKQRQTEFAALRKASGLDSTMDDAAAAAVAAAAAATPTSVASDPNPDMGLMPLGRRASIGVVQTGDVLATPTSAGLSSPTSFGLATPRSQATDESRDTLGRLPSSAASPMGRRRGSVSRSRPVPLTSPTQNRDYGNEPGTPSFGSKTSASKARKQVNFDL